MICFGKPGLTEPCTRIFNNMLYVQYIHLTKVKPIHMRQTHPLIRADVTLGL
jgi:hypothetical protein